MSPSDGAKISIAMPLLPVLWMLAEPEHYCPTQYAEFLIPHLTNNKTSLKFELAADYNFKLFEFNAKSMQ